MRIPNVQLFLSHSLHDFQFNECVHLCLCVDATCYYKLWLRRTPLQPICDQRNRENLGFSFAIFLFRPKSEVKRLAFSILHHRTQFFWGLFPINFFVYFFASLHSLRIIVKPLGITIPLTCPSTFYRSLAFSNGHTFFFREKLYAYTRSKT